MYAECAADIRSPYVSLSYGAGFDMARDGAPPRRLAAPASARTRPPRTV